jgi:3-oxoacyl-(acyl-carrier-protein) synthase/NAD(P)-dependent dehydrogenase (short-subunit alcohol dehydrogenase family)/phosphopantetheinyl transferase (holo-ACP synthase)
MPHDIQAGVSISGGSLGLPGLDEVFSEDAVERLLDGENFISQLPEEMREAIVDKRITRLQKHEDGGGELVEVDDIEEVVQLAAQRGDFDLGDEWNVPNRLVEALDETSRMAFAAGLEALRDAGLPLVPQYRETQSGQKITDGWKLPESIRDETGVIFASAFAGQDAFLEELESYHEDDDYEFDHRLLLKVLGIANSRFAEYIGARGPNTKINNACASTTTALGIAQDWLEQGRCKRVVVLSADNATDEPLAEWVESGFLATGAATTESDVEKAALPFDKRRHGMIVGMGAVGLVVEQAGLPESRGIEPLADLMGTHFVNSGHHPTRLDVDHISGEVGKLLDRVEEDFEIDRHDIADRTVFVSHETYTPARGGSADAEIESLRRNFGDAAEDIVIANTKGYTGHAQGASIEEILAVKSLQHQRVPAIANFEEPDPNLGDLRLSEGGDYPVDYALRLAAGFGSQLALALYRYRARTPDRLYDEERYQRWLERATDVEAPETTVEDRTLRVRERDSVAPDSPPDTSDSDSEEMSSVAADGGSAPRSSDTTANVGSLESEPRIATRDEDAERFPTEAVVVEAHSSAAYDPLELRERLEGRTVVVLGGPLLVTNLMERALDRCGAEVVHLEHSGDRSPLEANGDVCDLFDEEAIEREFDAIGRVDGIVNLLGFGQEEFEADDVQRAGRQTFHVARAWREHLGDDPGDGHFFTTITGMGGRLGFDQATSPLPVCGAVCGFTKSLGREWNDADVRVVDVPREGLYPDLGLQILSETFSDVPSPEVGLLGGVRYLPVTVPADEIVGHGAGESLAPDADSVLLIPGGAKGITARIACDLAERYGCTMVLAGRTELDHPDPLSVDMDEAKAEAKERIADRGNRVTPVRVQDELKPLRSQREIRENMNAMERAGSEVHYVSCDVQSAEAVQAMVDEVVERYGRLDGVIHAAGAESSDFLPKKTAETFDLVFDTKAVGGINLWNAVRDLEPSFFLTFSSVVARFGNVAQTDYCAANEVLNKLVAHVNATSPVRGLSIDWTAWDEIGMAVQGSTKTVLQSNGVEFLPPDIGAPMLGDALERGLTGECMIAGDLGALSAPYRVRLEEPGEATGRPHEQMAFDAETVEHTPGERLVVERVFDPERDRFLEDHVYEDVPVLPGVMGFEMMAEVARKLTGDAIRSIEDVDFDRAAKLHHGDPLRVVVTAEQRASDGETTEVEVVLETERTVKTGRTIRREHFRGTIECGEPLEADAIESFVFDTTDEYDAGPDRPSIYKRFFHTGVFEVIESVPHLSDDVAIGYSRKPTETLMSNQVDGTFVTDPMVREMAFQTVGLWGMMNHRYSYLPGGIGRAVQFDTAQPGERICIRARRRDESEERQLLFDVELRADDGRLLQRMERVELLGHRKLDDDETFPVPPARRMTMQRLSHPEAQALLSDRGWTVDEILTDDEAESYNRLRSDRRRGEWLAARVAAKELVSRYARDFVGERLDLTDVAIGKDEHGAPYVQLRGGAREALGDLPLPNLTLTHAEGVAIVGLAGPGPAARVGVDLEAIEERDDSFAENYLTDHERTLDLTNAEGETADDSTTWTALWSIKEAVSKALGLGLKLALSELHVDALGRHNGRIVADVTLEGRAEETYEALDGDELEVRVQVDGTFALASVHIELEEGADTRRHGTGNGRADAEGGNGSADGSDIEPTPEFAAVAALLKHKGLLDAERTRKATPDSVELPPWKEG